MLRITNLTTNLAQNLSIVRQFSCTVVRTIDQKWREDKGLPANPNAFGPLTNRPDYTFLDGRLTPMGANQKRRLKKQQDIAVKIVTLNSELDFAKKRRARIQAEEAAERQRLMQAKLKPKGHLLLQKDGETEKAKDEDKS